MKLINLVQYLKKPNGIQEMIKTERIDIEEDSIDIYFKNSLHLNSDLRFFDTEKISGRLEMEVDGDKYINLFPLYLAKELVEDFSKLPEYNTDEKLAKRLLEYRINDA